MGSVLKDSFSGLEFGVLFGLRVLYLGYLDPRHKVGISYPATLALSKAVHQGHAAQKLMFVRHSKP